MQSTGCAPIVRAFERGERDAERWEGAATLAHGICVPRALGDFLILDAVRASGGAALSVSDETIVAAWRDRVEVPVARPCGIVDSGPAWSPLRSEKQRTGGPS